MVCGFGKGLQITYALLPENGVPVFTNMNTSFLGAFSPVL
jgi:hypothetical protein